MKLLGVDVGGTFTDLVYTDTATGVAHIHKAPTTPDDPAQGVLGAVHALCVAHGLTPGTIDHVLHGTTIATNAVLEHRGVTTGMITTKGYRDIVHIARHQRPQNYSIRQEVPWQDRLLVKRRHRLTVTERRIPPRGEVLVALDEEEVRVAARQLKGQGVEAIAVCFLFSYLNPEHEERAAAIVREEFPEAYVCTSAGVSPQFREFERFTTASMNAYIGPKVGEYVRRLGRGLADAGVGAELHVMGSNGGVATAQMVVERPISTLLSGPAAGVLGGAWTGALEGRSDLITFDVGGTSADIGIVREGSFAEASARDTWIAGYPLMVPMIDIHTIGAGGGSIAYVDHGGAFRVGPSSAGAVPGPAAYGRGGTQPTVTDANVVLGRLDVDNFLGGEMILNDPAAAGAVQALADRLELSLEDCAEGILTAVNANMANAIRSRTVQKGIDPRDFSLVAFGGAGPLHAADVASELGIKEVIVPAFPGITSAVGLLTTDLKYDAIRTQFQVQGALDLQRLISAIAEMEDELGQRLTRDNVPASAMSFVRAADLRYVGQGYELRIPLPGGALGEATLEGLWTDFHRMHAREYGHGFANPIEIVNVRVTGLGQMPKIGRLGSPASGDLASAELRRGTCFFRVADAKGVYPTVFYARDRLPANASVPGPAIVLQRDATTVVPPGCRFEVRPSGNLVIIVED